MVDTDPYIAKSHDVTLDKEYNDWLDELDTRYVRACARAAVKVNGEKLLWNWQTGRDLVMRKAEEKWGTGIVEQLSLDLQRRHPGEKGFSSANLWAMKRWYLFYSEKLDQAGQESRLKLEQAVQELLYVDRHGDIKLEQVAQEIEDTEQGDGISFPPLFYFVPWWHHVSIVKKCKTLKEAAFYLHRTITEGWSRAVLERQLKNDAFGKQGGAISNFSEYLPSPHADLVQEMTKENYDFGFITLPKKYAEKQLEDALCEQMTQFLLELGSGFAFVGRQKELVVDGVSRRIDLLFYHIKLRCYIVLELKAVAFQPEFAGKLNFYVTAVNHLLKGPEDNPTIGLLICSNMRETEVKWSFETINAPIGVATYSNIEEIKAQLPTVEQLQERIKLLEYELSKQNRKKNRG